MDTQQKIGICGLACFKCRKFIKKECNGCEPNEFCPLTKCAEDKGVDCCFSCDEFPCKTNYEDGPIVKDTLDYFKGE
ncbi:DUF3795 domain-containing protein [Patescibacteria group bacterium]